jgi:predicted O-methyltransferase YrrM
LVQDFSQILDGLKLPHTDDPEVAFKWAQSSLQKNDWEKAVGLLRRAVELSPTVVTFNLALSLSLFMLGEISESAKNFAKTIELDEKLLNTPEYANVSDFKQNLFNAPQNTLAGFLQGTNAPERQVFMSAALGSLTPLSETMHVLEIGSYAGSSMLTWSNAAEKLLDCRCEITCIDPWGDAGTDLYNDSMAENLKSKRTYEVFCHNAALSGDRVKITPIRGISNAILPALEDQKFDLIFIDGSHYYADVLADITECARLLKIGGIICGDDLELQLSQCDVESALKNKMSDFILDPKSNAYFHPGVTLSVGEYFGDVSYFSGFLAMWSTSTGYEKLSLRNARGVRPSHWPDEFQVRISAYFEKSTELGQLL